MAVILQAAAQLLAQSGTLTTNAVAARAGVSVGSLYQYFPDKRGILLALWARDLAALLDELPAHASGAAGPLALAGARRVVGWWLDPARQALWAALGDADQHALIQQTVLRASEALQTSLAHHPELRADPMGLVACLVGGWTALRRARVAAGADADLEALTLELAILALGPLSAPQARWRAATGEDPASLGRSGLWRRERPTRERPLRQWVRARPSQGRARASFTAVVSAAGELLEAGASYTAERLAQQAGVSVGTVYRYFADKHFAIGEFGIAQLARFTERLVDASPGIYIDAPGGSVQRMVKLTLDPLRSPVGRALRRVMVDQNEWAIMAAQIDHLDTLLRPVVLRHPLCGVDGDHLKWMLHAIEGLCDWLAGVQGLAEDPLGYGALVEAGGQLAFTFCAADRAVARAVCAGQAPLTALHKDPGLAR
ncbi:MAG: TetR family transcriptional regulator [Myxococcales bacterium]|nr:TetR family transcriptional regulator [Myxococcales bacterium]